MRSVAVAALCALTAIPALAQQPDATISAHHDKFRQLEETLPTPTTYRTASGAPGHEYWQQRADYTIDVELDDANQRIIGSETVAYHNNSPDTLTYLWLQLDQNIFAKGAASDTTSTAPEFDRVPFDRLDGMLTRADFDGGDKIGAVKDGRGRPLPYTVVGTMMRIDLAEPLAPGASVAFGVDWGYNINDAKKIRGRTGYEFFEEDGNYIYEIAQWFPRMAAYTDVNGWQHKQFLGCRRVHAGVRRLSAFASRCPNDHVVAAHRRAAESRRGPHARAARAPRASRVGDEAGLHRDAGGGEGERRARKPTGKKTWVFKAENVRDFAFASSRKFIWDAMRHRGRRQPRDGDVLLSEGGRAAVEPVLDAGHHAHAGRLLAIHLHVPLSDGDLGQRAGRRHGIPDDLLQRAAPRGGRHLLRSARSTA